MVFRAGEAMGVQFTEMGRDDGKTLVLLPGTACT